MRARALRLRRPPTPEKSLTVVRKPRLRCGDGGQLVASAVHGDTLIWVSEMHAMHS